MILFIATFKVFKTTKGTFPESLRSLAHKMKKIDFYCFFLIFENNDSKKIAIHTFVSETFYKNISISKVK